MTEGNTSGKKVRLRKHRILSRLISGALKRHDIRNQVASILLTTAPAWIGFLIEAIPLAYGQWPPSRKELIDVLVSTTIGITISFLFWALKTAVANFISAERTRHFSQVQEAMGLIPAPQLVRGLVGRQPESFLQYLAKERERQNQGLKLLKSSHKWPLTTPRAYESIVHFLRQATEFQIIDHDIRRWFEILRGQDLATSTTFNYSHYILDITERRVASGKLDGYKRIFMVYDHALPTLKDEHIPADWRRDWEMIPEQTRVLLTIWDFEKRLREVHGFDTDSGTRVIRVDRQLSPILQKRITDFKDIVLVNQEVCFQEDLLFEVQSHPKTSFDTKSRLYTGGKYVQDAPALFEILWERAEAIEDFSSFHRVLADFPEHHRIGDF